MPNIFRKTIKAVFSYPAIMRGQSIRDDPLQFIRSRPTNSCPICDSEAVFWSFGRSPRGKALCSKCGALERHRLIYIFFDTHREVWQNKRILHFAPEPGIGGLIRPNADYTTTDLCTDGTHGGIDVELDITEIDAADESYDIVIANHVLEHLDDDRAAMREILRILRPGGLFIVNVPLIHGWVKTYEDQAITDPASRNVHFGNPDHRRIYGRDFDHRLSAEGFDVDTFQVDPSTEIRFGLSQGDTIFLGKKAS